MKRPDQYRFNQFSQHFETIDHSLETFSNNYGFSLEKNVNHVPCRILRKSGNPELIIDIYLDDNWFNIEYDADLPHSFAAATFYVPQADDMSLWKLSIVLAEHQPFSAISQCLQTHLETAVQLFQSWTPDIIMQHGKRFRNLNMEWKKGLLK